MCDEICEVCIIESTSGCRDEGTWIVREEGKETGFYKMNRKY